MSDKPKRRFDITIKIGGDTISDAVCVLDDFIRKIESGGKGCAHGGPSGGGYFDVIEDATMTHDRYISELKSHLDAKLDKTKKERETKG